MNYDIAVQDGDLRIFPEKLKSEELNIPEPYRLLLEKTFYRDELEFPFQCVNISNLIKALTELKLKSIDASKKEGIFSWEINACVYYKIGETGDAIKGRHIELTYFIAGKEESICGRLNNKFSAIINRLLGPPISNSNTLKKS